MAVVFDSPIYTGDASIERVLNAGLPVVLIFVDGALPHALEAEMKALAKQHAGRLLLAQVSIKDSPESARRFAVQSTPAVVTIKAGQPHSGTRNISSATQLREHTRYLLGEGPRPVESSSPPQQAHATGASSGAPVTVTDATFESEVLRSPLPVLVDFWAPWCGPCRMVAPILEKLSREMQGQIKIAKVNVDEHSRYAGQFGVRAIPTMLLVRDGKVIDQWAGALPEAPLRSRLAKVL